MLRLQFPFNPAAHVVFFRAAAFSYSSHIAWDIVRTVDELPEIVPFLYFEQYNRNRNDFCFRCGGRFFFLVFAKRNEKPIYRFNARKTFEISCSRDVVDERRDPVVLGTRYSGFFYYHYKEPTVVTGRACDRIPRPRNQQPARKRDCVTHECLGKKFKKNTRSFCTVRVPLFVVRGMRRTGE